MNLKVYHFFTILNIVRSDIRSAETINNEFKTFVENLVLKHVKSSRFIGIFHDNKGIHGMKLPELLESRHQAVMVHDLMTKEVLYNSSEIVVPKISMKTTEHNIIIIEDSKTLRSMLQVANSIPYFSARTNALVILTGRVPGTEKWIRQSFSQLWEIYVLNIGLVFYTDRVNLYTYVPWTSPHEVHDLTDQGISANIFFDKLDNLHKYPIKILEPRYSIRNVHTNVNNGTIYIGIDAMTINIILQRRNATSKMIKLEEEAPSPCRFVHYNYTIQGMFGADEQNDSIDVCPFSLKLPATWKKSTELEIIDKNADVSFESRPLRIDIDYRVDTSSFQEMDSYCLMVPANQRVSQAFSLLLPFETRIWIAILLNFIIHIAMYVGMQTLSKTNEKGFLHTCFMLYGIQISTVPPSRKLQAQERQYLLGWILYSFFISAAYQSVFMSFLTVPVFAPPINHIKELIGVDFSIFVSTDILADMHNSLDKETSEILLPRVVLDLWTGKRKYDPKNGYLVPLSTARYLIQRQDLTDDDGRSLFHLMAECPMPLITSYQMPRGSPLMQPINEFALVRSESGLVQIWQKNAIHYLNKQIPTRNLSDKGYGITLSEVQGAFYILIIGNAIGLCAFLVEFCWKRTRLLKSYPENTNRNQKLN